MTKPTDKEIEFLHYGIYYDSDEGDYLEELETDFKHVKTQSYVKFASEVHHLLVIKNIKTGEVWGAEVQHDSWHEEPLEGVKVYPVELKEITEARWVRYD